MHDPDAPAGDFVHWVMFNIPATLGHLPEGRSIEAISRVGSCKAVTANRVGYDGRCFRLVSCRCVFDLFALDEPLRLHSGATRDDLMIAIQGSRARRGRARVQLTAAVISAAQSSRSPACTRTRAENRGYASRQAWTLVGLRGRASPWPVRRRATPRSGTADLRSARSGNRRRRWDFSHQCRAEQDSLRSNDRGPAGRGARARGYPRTRRRPDSNESVPCTRVW